jgi:sucrose-phosphate synthase
VDIIGNCHNGLLVDPLDKDAIGRALLQLLENPQQWREYSVSGIENVRKYYSWDAHAESYMDRIKPLLQQERPPYHAPRSMPAPRQDRAIFTDLDQNLLGEAEGLQNFIAMIRRHRRQALFGIATGRRLDSASAILKQYDIPLPDVLLTSLGTEIYYAPELSEHAAWARHIDHLWQRRAIRRTLADLPGLSLQPASEQSRFKISYYYDAEHAPSIEEIKTLLRKEELAANVIHAFGQFLDIIPVRASKGLALRYLAHQWQIPLEHILVAGGSGADEDMMRGNTLAVVVANRHHEELSQLVEHEQIYFAKQPYALGIMEAIEHYDFFRAKFSAYD